MGSLGYVRSWDLDKFHHDHLQPNEEFLQKARQAIHSICEFLKASCFKDGPRSDIKVQKVVKGGSLGKGTSMKNGSDADLVLFLNTFKSFTDQETKRKEIIDEIERRLNKWQKEPYKLSVDVGLLLDLLESYRDLEKDPEEIIQKIRMWLQEYQKELYLSDADLVQLNNFFNRYLKMENDQMMIIKEIKWWRNKGQKEPHFSNADLQFLLNLYKRYRDKEEARMRMIEEIKWCQNKGQKEPHFSNADLQILLDSLQRYISKKMMTNEFAKWQNNDQGKPYLSDADLGFLLYFLERYTDSEEQMEMERWWKEGGGEPYLSNGHLGLLLDLLKRYTEKEEEQKMIFKETERWFKQCKKNLCLEFIFEKSKWPNPRVLQFKICSQKPVDFIEFDVLPAYDALGQYDGSRPDPQIYVDLILTGKSGEFSPCFTELQRDFIKEKTPKLKNLIRLVKHWYKEVCCLEKGFRVQEKSFPPKYALELLTVYAWEQGSGQDQFDTAEGFRTVLWLIEHYKEIRIYWTKYYDFDNEVIKWYLQDQLCKNRPVILDPADPTANFGQAKGWDRLAEKAKSYASMTCCRKRDGSLVEPWNVPGAAELQRRAAVEVLPAALAMGSLGPVDSWRLDKFHSEHLQPNKEFLRRAGEEIERICDFLKRRCFQDAPWSGLKVVKVVKGGSLGKGTSMKNGSDADLVLFLNISRSYTDQEKERKKIIEEIARWLNLWQKLRLSDAVQKLFLDLIKIYKAQEKERKMFIEEIARRIDEWQKQPYLSDADLELFSNIFKSYADQENDWKRFIHAIARELSEWPFSHHDWDLLWNLIKSYIDQEKDWRKIFEETERQVINRQMKPYLSDADLVLFLNIFRSYTDQEEDRKGIIQEIERRLDEWQNEPYKLDVDVGLLLDLLESYRDPEKDPKEITQKINMWLRECKKELCLSEADLVPFHHIWETYKEQENDRKRLIQEIARWRKEGRGEPYLSNADLGLLLGLLKRYTEKEKQQNVIFKEMERWFNQCKENMRLELIFEKSKWSNPRVLQFKLRSKKSVDFIDFDVLPAYDALGQFDGSRPDPQIYVDLIKYGPRGDFSSWFIELLKNFILNRPTKSGAFSPCFTELQKDFIVGRPSKLKSLIRLVKYWYNEVCCLEKGFRSFPPKYALELLTVYAWEQGSGQYQFDTAEGFRTVLWLIEHYKEIRIYWTKYYDFDNEVIKRYLQGQLCKKRPVILDPADPTANLGKAKGWDRLARKAKSYAAMNCCRNRDGSLVEPWNVPFSFPEKLRLAWEVRNPGGPYKRRRSEPAEARDDGGGEVFLGAAFADGESSKHRTG
ncbi:2'-5'-oligoadenylate synthase 3-like [Pituophis catenifer annectens]|uniref:2'-5'-oligoadenylate synthase 3-like n=1 Tax=Pituophis catenifer annectens TaxID=94852 RepID=UPI0039930A63